MKQLYQDCYDQINLDRLMRQTSELYEIERGQTFTHHHRAVDKVIEILNADGFSNVERLAYPADGRTAYQDKRMPLAWDATIGRLTLLNADQTKSANDKFAPSDATSDVVADYARHPFHLVKGSTATPPAGIVAKIITEAQFLSGDDPRDALVILEPGTWPRRHMLTPILDRGGLGFVTDFLVDRYQTPDAIQWVQACSENTNWHVDEETRPFIGFSVSPRVGDRIRALAAKGGLTAKVESNGRRYEGVVPGVTALIPGRRREEFWLIAHLFEPLATDDSNGVMAAMETARLIRQRGTPEFSVRLLFCMELYGFAAYAESRSKRAGGIKTLRDEVIGACNFDSVPSTRHSFIRLELGGPGTPFYGNALAEILANHLKDFPTALAVKLPTAPEYFDDLFLTDPTVGVPVVWPLNGFPDAVYWHNSAQDMNHIDPEHFRRGTAFDATLVSMTVNPETRFIPDATSLAIRKLQAAKTKATCPEHFEHLYRMEASRLADFARFAGEEALKPSLTELALFYSKNVGEITGVPRRSAWRDYAEEMTPTRLTAGFTQDLTRVPKEERIAIPDDVIYGPLSNVIANMDGRKNLARLLREAEYERDCVLDEAEIKKDILAICFLADYGYFSMKNSREIRKPEILAALKRLGVQPGDLLLVHSSLSSFGHIEGGAETVIEALGEAVGPEGTLLFPAFNRCYRLLESINAEWSYRPYDQSDLSSLRWVGTVPITFLRRHPDALRSAHFTHSWTGFGRLAKECLVSHSPDDSPASAESPMGKALEFGGKILHFGSGLGATTFLHYFEDRLNLPGLGPALIGVRESDGSTRNVLIQKHLPGDRHFYHDGEDAPFFRRAKEAGLEIFREKLGLGELKLMEMKPLYEIGRKICLDDPNIL